MAERDLRVDDLLRAGIKGDPEAFLERLAYTRECLSSMAYPTEAVTVVLQYLEEVERDTLSAPVRKMAAQELDSLRRQLPE